MSHEPRLLDEAKTQGLGRELLRTGAGIRLSEQRKAQVWERIAAGLPPPGDPGASGPSAPAAPSASGAAPLFSGAAKLGAFFGIGALWVGAWFVGTSLARQPSAAPVAPAVSVVLPAVAPPEPRAVEPSPRLSMPAEISSEAPAKASAPVLPRSRAVASVDAPSVQDPASEPDAPAPTVPEEPPPVASATPAEAARQERINLLREEAAMTRSARGALRAGNASQALQILGQIQEKIGGRGELHQEREALAIEALARTGQQAAASARAEAFLKAFPKSPLAPDVKMFAR